MPIARKPCFVIALAFLIAAPVTAETVKPFQDQAHWEAAILNHPGVGNPSDGDVQIVVYMTGESFVLATIFDERARTRHTGCVQSWLLVWAVHQEKDIDLDRAEKIVLASQDHVFHFSRRTAIRSLMGRSRSFFGYTDAELKHARRRFGRYTNEQLLAGAWQQEYDAVLNWSAASACALIERGLSARRGDRPPTIEVFP